MSTLSACRCRWLAADSNEPASIRLSLGMVANATAPLSSETLWLFEEEER